MSEEKSEYQELPTTTLTNVPIFRAGSWTDMRGRKTTYKISDLHEMVANFKQLGQRIKPFFKLMHLSRNDHQRVTAAPALGWLSNLRVVGDQLVTDILKVPKKLADMIAAGSYRRVSAEIFRQFYDEATGRTFKNVVSAAGLLGAQHPAVTTLDDVVKLFESDEEAEQYFLDDGEWRADLLEAPGAVSALACFSAEIKEGGEGDMDEAAIQRLVQDSVTKEVKAVEDRLTEQHKAEFSAVRDALGIDENADPVTAIKSLKSDTEAQANEIAERDKASFQAGLDAVIADAKREGKLLPAQESMIRDLAESKRRAAEEANDGKAEFSIGEKVERCEVIDGLKRYFEASPVINTKLTEKGSYSAESNDKEKAVRIDKDVGRFIGEEMDIQGVCGDVQAERIQAYQMEHKCDFATAFESITGYSIASEPDAMSFSIGADGEMKIIGP